MLRTPGGPYISLIAIIYKILIAEVDNSGTRLGKKALCVARSDFSEIARILTFSLNLVRIRSDFTFLSKKNAKIYFPFAGLFKK